MCSLYGTWSRPGPVWTITTVGTFVVSEPPRRTFAPSASKKSSTPFTLAFMPERPYPKTTGRLHWRCPVSTGTGAAMFDSVTVIGAGRVGSAVSARLRERGVDVRDDGDLQLLCVPDRAIPEVARGIAPGPWVAHVSGATQLA